MLRLPVPLTATATIGPRFLLKPILTYVLSDQPFLLLALSRNHVKLYRGSRDVFEQVTVPGLPENINAALNIDSADRGEQVRSIRRGDGGKDDAIFHGQGGKPETHKEDFVLFLKELQRHLHPILEREHHPLLLAGVDYELAIFRQSCTYPHLMETQLNGNADRLSQHDLHTRAWQHIQSKVDTQLKQSIGRYRQDAERGMTSRELRDVVPAAKRGDIDTLFVQRDRTCWGHFDPQSEALVEHDRRELMDDELFDYATVQTWLARGMLHVLEFEQMPEPTGIAAIHRRGRVPQPAMQFETATR